MTGKEKEAVARGIAAAMRNAEIPVDDHGRLRASAREDIAMHLVEELSDLLGVDADTMALYYDSAGLTVEVHRG